MVDDETRGVFDSLVCISAGRGDRVLFWRDRWIHGFSVTDIAPNIRAMVDTRVINHRTVEQATIGERWIQDVHGDIPFMAHMQMMHLQHAIATVQRHPLAADRFTWPYAGVDRTYSAKAHTVDYAKVCPRSGGCFHLEKLRPAQTEDLCLACISTQALVLG